MKYKKIMFMLVLAVFLLSITCVSASEIDNTITSENANTIELSADNDIEDNLQTSEENEASASTDYDEAIPQTDTEVLGADSAKYSDLAEEIGHSGNITLTHKNYTYDKGETISISEANKVIDGNGAVIDMNGSTIRAFTVTASGVTIKNLTIKNVNYAGSGGAIYVTSSGTVTNCNFADNTATYGGAVIIIAGAVTNCNFVNNTASIEGGAVYFYSAGNVTNCNFTDNTATREGGAVFFRDVGEVSNCNFTNNKATGTVKYEGGGAVYFYSAGNVTNCNFTDNTATRDGGAVYFYQGTGSVTNCNFTNNTAGEWGGAVLFNSNGTVTNCNFTNNKATGINSWGGAVFFNREGTVSNCNFTGNSAYHGGAVYFYGEGTGSVTNCNFTSNTASYDGGAIRFSGSGNVSNCNFADNSASRGGAIYSMQRYTTADTCIFKTDSDTTFNTHNLPPTLNVNNFTTVHGSGEKLTFDLKTNSSIPVTNGNISISVYFKGNGEWVRNYTCLSGEGWIPDLPVGSYIAVFNTEYAEFQEINRTVTINKVNSTIALDNIVLDYGESANVTVTTTGATGITAKIDGNDVTVINNYDIQVSGLKAGNYTLTVTTIPDDDHNPVTATFKITVNKVESTLTVDDIVFDYGSEGSGNVSFAGASEVIANVVSQPSAVVSVNGKKITVSGLAAGTYTLNVTTVPDENHTAVTETATITVNKVNSSLTLDDVELDYGESINVTVSCEGATGIDAKIDGADVACDNFVIQISDLNAGNHTLTVATVPDENHTAVTKTATITVNKISSSLTVDDVEVDYGSTVNVTVAAEGATGITAKIDGADVIVDGYTISISDLSAGSHTLAVTAVPDGNHTAVTKTATITVNKISSSLTVDDVEVDYGSTVNVTVAAEGATGITAKIDGADVVVDGYTISISDLSAGSHTLAVTAVPDGNHTAVTKTATITVNKVSTNLTAAGVTATYKVNKYLVIKLTDSEGNPLANSTVTVDLNGAKNYTTDENGQIKIKVSNMVPKTYSAKISYAGNDNYIGSNATTKVVVKKATPKITANAKTFKTTTKTKKYTITLKDNTGKAIKNAKVTLKVNGKTYKATTNSKGKATFKITKLTKKGTFKATITYTGNKYYNKVTKKANIKVISSWKTISKGSKDKSTVREIQQALKNHGYYLTAYGHYLMVDGVYADCTVRSVKEFQHDKGLKVTGKVDEKTAKKLGLI